MSATIYQLVKAMTPMMRMEVLREMNEASEYDLAEEVENCISTLEERADYAEASERWVIQRGG